MDVAVVGPGAIGISVAACLSERGIDATLCGRSPRERLEMRPVWRDRPVVIPRAVITDSAAVAQVDLVLVAVKATQIPAIGAWLDALCHPDTVVCSLQNGIEHVELLRPLIPRGPIVASVVWFPAEEIAPGVVNVRDRPRITVASGPGALSVVDAFAGTDCSVEVADDFVTVAWRKLLQNAVAAFMVLARRRAGIFRRTDVAQLARRYLLESLTVARASGARLDDGIIDEIVDNFSSWPEDLGTSMLFDALAGRPLEWDIRNGAIVRRAREHGIPTPIGDVIVALLAAASDGPG